MDSSSLSNRKFIVRYEYAAPSLKTAFGYVFGDGVPQGDALLPFLFVAYIFDICSTHEADPRVKIIAHSHLTIKDASILRSRKER